MSKRNSLIVKKLPQMGSKMPSGKLIRFEKSDDLKNYFYSLRKDAMELANFLAYKLGRGGKNPIRSAYHQGKISSQQLDCIELYVDLYLNIWDIISTAWESYLKDVYREIGIETDIQLFQAVLAESYDEAFKAAKKGYKFVHQQHEKILRLMRNECWFGNGTVPSDRSPIWEIINNHKDVRPSPQWNLIKQIIKPYQFTDRAINRKLKKHQHLISELGDAQLKLYEWQRLNRKAKSEKWQSGEYYVGQKGGFRKCRYTT